MSDTEHAELVAISDALRVALEERDALVRDVEYWRRIARELEASEQEENARAKEAEARVARLERALREIAALDERGRIANAALTGDCL